MAPSPQRLVFMRTYVIRRLIEGVVTIFGVMTLTFLIVHLLPGDAVNTLMRNIPNEYADQMRHALGLDQPLLTQYFSWLGPLITRLDLGRGITINESVSTLLWQRLPVTIELAILSIVIGIVIALPLGILAARFQGSWLDYIAMQFSQLCQAVPDFWIGTLLFLLLAMKLHILPAGGWVPLSENIWDNLRRLLMPSLALALPEAGILTRITRSSMLEVLSKDYIVTAYSKGLKRFTVMQRHALKNALLPVITMIGVETGYLLGGSVIIEDIFLLPGVGKLVVTALNNRDVAIIQGCLLFYATLFVGINLFVDILYGVIDPRISYD
jgi:peptide/nickel transport system permease protein